MTISPPLGWQVSNVPDVHNADLKVLLYNLTAEKKDGSLHVRRKLMVNVEMLDTKYYTSLRKFFQTAKSGDEQQVILSASRGAN